MTEVAIPEDTTPEAHTPAIISVIERAALDPNVDIDKMERLLDMQERILNRDAEMAFNAAMATAQQEMGAVTRDANNDQTRSKYARLETIAKTIKPVITRHGFAMSFGTDVSPIDSHYRVTCRVSHSAGHSKDYHADVPSDLTGMKGNPNKTATHAFGSTMSYGRRYLTLLIFDIATEDDDGNNAGGLLTVTPEQYIQLRDLVEETGSKEDVFLKYFGAQSLETFPAKKFEAALASLEKKREANNAAA